MVTRVLSGPSSASVTVVNMVSGQVGDMWMTGDFFIFVAELLGVDDAIGAFDLQVFRSSVHFDVSRRRHEIKRASAGFDIGI